MGQNNTIINSSNLAQITVALNAGSPLASNTTNSNNNQGSIIVPINVNNNLLTPTNLQQNNAQTIQQFSTNIQQNNQEQQKLQQSIRLYAQKTNSPQQVTELKKRASNVGSNSANVCINLSSLPTTSTNMQQQLSQSNTNQ